MTKHTGKMQIIELTVILRNNIKEMLPYNPNGVRCHYQTSWF